MKQIGRIGLLFIFLITTSVFGQDEDVYLPIDMQNIDSLEQIASFDIDLDDNRNSISTIKFHPSDPIVYSLEFNESIRIWDMSTFEFAESIALPTEYATYFSVNPNGEFIVYGGWDFEEQPDFATLNIWDFDQEESELLLRQGDENFALMEFSPDGNRFAVVSPYEASIQIWDSETLEQLAVLSGHDDRVNNIAFLTNDELISSGDDGQIQIWNVNDETIIQTFEGYFFIKQPLAQSILITTEIENEYRFLELSENDVVETSYVISGRPFAFNQSGDILATVEEGEIWLYSFQERERIIAIGEYFGNFPPPIGFSPDGYFLATAGTNPVGSINVWAIPRP